ncbi:MAG: cell division protease FtsH [Elusimicrobia bacterium]|nr:MAG: cell division protease FtsH [Elusimicrobiota bacterium]
MNHGTKPFRTLAAALALSIVSGSLGSEAAAAMGRVVAPIRVSGMGAPLGFIGAMSPTSLSSLPLPAAPATARFSLPPIPANTAVAAALKPAAVVAASLVPAPAARAYALPGATANGPGAPGLAALKERTENLFRGLPAAGGEGLYANAAALLEPDARRPAAVSPVVTVGDETSPRIRRAQLDNLARRDPAAAVAEAARIVSDAAVERYLKLSSLLLLIGQPMPEASAALTATAGTDGEWWYLRREAAIALGRRAGTLGDHRAQALAALRKARASENLSVRLAAHGAILEFGEADAGDGLEPIDPSTPVAPTAAPTPKLGFWAQDLANAKNALKGAFSLKALKTLGIILLVTVPLSIGMVKSVEFGSRTWQTAAETRTAREIAAAQVQDPRLAELQKQVDALIESRKDDAAGQPASASKQSPEVQALQSISRENRRIGSQLGDISHSINSMIEKQQAAGEFGWGKLLGALWFPVLMIGLMVWMYRRQMKASGMGKGSQVDDMKKDMLVAAEKPTTRFADVAGIDSVRKEVAEVADFLINPARYRTLGARPPKGILLEGGPGTGKTLLARALAGETNAAFYSKSGSDFVEMFVGLGASKVRALFDEAKKHAPAIIFIDEIDAVGRSRGGASNVSGGSDEREQTLNQILAEMDGFDNSGGVVVIAATNRADVLDKALTRPGRFDRTIKVGLPDALGRLEILAVHAKNKPLSPDVDLRATAERTSGLSGAYLENVLNEAALLAARLKLPYVVMSLIDRAIERVSVGLQNDMLLTPQMKQRVALHEAGHAIGELLVKHRAVRCIPRASSKTGSSGCSAGRSPSSSHTGNGRPAARTTSSRPPTWPGGWSRSSAWTRSWGSRTRPGAKATRLDAR